MTIDQFIKQFNGQKVDYDGAFGYQCVDLANFYLWKVYGIRPGIAGIVGAVDIFTNKGAFVSTKHADYIPYSKGFVPIKGDIIIWGSNVRNGALTGRFGHVGIVVSADSNGFKSLDQNWGYNGTKSGSGIGTKKTEIENHSYEGIIGVVRMKQSQSTVINVNTPQPMSNTELANAQRELIRYQKKGLIEAIPALKNDAYFDPAIDANAPQTQIDTLNRYILGIVTEKERLKTEVEANKKEVDRLRSLKPATVSGPTTSEVQSLIDLAKSEDSSSKPWYLSKKWWMAFLGSTGVTALGVQFGVSMEVVIGVVGFIIGVYENSQGKVDAEGVKKTARIADAIYRTRETNT